MRVTFLEGLFGAIMLVLTASAGVSQTVGAGAPEADPQAPLLPATFVRAQDGRSTIRAVRLTSPLTLDGRLDEEIYGAIQPASGFFRENPADGKPANDDTQVWVFFDSNNVYIALRCLDNEPERMVANEMKRDSFQIW